MAYDGSTKGRYDGDTSNPDPQSIATHDYLVALMDSAVFDWIESLWPCIMGTFSAAISYGGYMIIQLSVDLLCDFRVESLHFETPLDDNIPEPELIALQSNLPNPIEDLGGVLGIVGASLSAYWFALDTLVALSVLGPTATLTLAAIAAFIVLWSGWLIAIEVGVNSGHVSLDEARSLTLGFAFGLVLETALFVLITGAVTLVRHGFTTVRTFFVHMKQVAEKWGIISFALKFLILTVTLLMYARYYQMTLLEYGE